MDKRILTVPQVQERLNCSRATVYNMAGRGDLVLRKLGRKTVVLNDDLDALISGLPVKPLPQMQD